MRLCMLYRGCGGRVSELQPRSLCRRQRQAGRDVVPAAQHSTAHAPRGEASRSLTQERALPAAGLIHSSRHKRPAVPCLKGSRWARLAGLLVIGTAARCAASAACHSCVQSERGRKGE